MRKIMIMAMAAGAFALAGCKSEPAEDAEQTAEAGAEGELDDESADAPSDVIETDDEATGEQAE